MLSSRPIGLPTDGPLFPTKTPGRSLKNRAENVHAGMGASMTVNGKGKNAPKTPFQPSSVQPHFLKNQKTILTTVGRPLVDKTPMPNRIGAVLFKTPLPENQKLLKLRDDKGQENHDSPVSAQRPSSMRKHIKHPRFSGKALETPANVGKHWEFSDEEIVLEAQPAQQEIILEQEDDLDEIEYGPPNTLHIPFEPYFGFDLPNYTEVGKSLFDLAHSHHYEEVAPPSEIEIPSSEFENMQWDMIPLPDIASDDPFFLARLEEKLKPVPVAPVPLHLRSKSVHGKSVKPQATLKPRSHSSLATVDSSRPATRMGRVASTSSTSILDFTQQKVNSRNTTTIARPLREPVSRTSKPHTSTATRTGSATTSTTAASSRRAVASSTVTSKAAKTPITAASTVRRPHTSLAATRPLRAPKRTSEDAAGDGLFLIPQKGANTLEDELDFKFEV